MGGRLHHQWSGVRRTHIGLRNQEKIGHFVPWHNPCSVKACGNGSGAIQMRFCPGTLALILHITKRAQSAPPDFSTEEKPKDGLQPPRVITSKGSSRWCFEASRMCVHLFPRSDSCSQSCWGGLLKLKESAPKRKQRHPGSHLYGYMGYWNGVDDCVRSPNCVCFCRLVYSSAHQEGKAAYQRDRLLMPN